MHSLIHFIVIQCNSLNNEFTITLQYFLEITNRVSITNRSNIFFLSLTDWSELLNL